MPDLTTDISPALIVAMSVQVTLCLLGLVFQWRYWQSRKSPAQLPTWAVNGTHFAQAALLTIVSGIVGQTVLVNTLGIQNDTLWQLLVPGGGFQFGVLFGALLSARFLLRPSSPQTLPILPPSPEPEKPKRNPLVEGIRTFVAIVPLTAGASLLWVNGLNALGIDTPQQDLIDAFIKADKPGPFFALTFVAVILAPLTEEIVFRGGLFHFAKGRIPRWLAVLGPAVVFAALHVNLASFFPLVVLGSLFALAYERSGRLIVPIVAHSLFNLNTILLVLCGAGK